MAYLWVSLGTGESEFRRFGESIKAGFDPTCCTTASGDRVFPRLQALRGACVDFRLDFRSDACDVRKVVSNFGVGLSQAFPQDVERVVARRCPAGRGELLYYARCAGAAGAWVPECPRIVDGVSGDQLSQVCFGLGLPARFGFGGAVPAVVQVGGGLLISI